MPRSIQDFQFSFFNIRRDIWNFPSFLSKIYSRRAECLQLCFYHFASCLDFFFEEELHRERRDTRTLRLLWRLLVLFILQRVAFHKWLWLSFERIYVSSASLPDIIIACVIKFREGTWNRRRKSDTLERTIFHRRCISVVTIVQSWWNVIAVRTIVSRRSSACICLSFFIFGVLECDHELFLND